MQQVCIVYMYVFMYLLRILYGKPGGGGIGKLFRTSYNWCELLEIRTHCQFTPACRFKLRVCSAFITVLIAIIMGIGYNWQYRNSVVYMFRKHHLSLKRFSPGHGRAWQEHKCTTSWLESSHSNRNPGRIFTNSRAVCRQHFYLDQGNIVLFWFFPI